MSVLLSDMFFSWVLSLALSRSLFLLVKTIKWNLGPPGASWGPPGAFWIPLAASGGFWEAIPRLRLTFAFDALLGAVVAFWLSFGVAFGTDFFYYLVAWLFVCKCSPRGCRGFPGSVWRLRLSI